MLILYLCFCLSEIISWPLIGRKSETSRDVARRRTVAQVEAKAAKIE